MKIILNQDEIAQIVQDALIDYASQHLVIGEGSEPEVIMNDDGSATIVINAPGKAPRKTRGRKAEIVSETKTNIRPFRTKEEPVEHITTAEETNSEEPPFETNEAPKEETSEETSDEAAPAAPPARSLFSNLRKPVNS